MNDNVALAIPQDAPAEILRMGQINPDIARRALAIMAGRKVDDYNPPLQPARAIAAALYEEQTGQIEGRDFFVDNRMGIVAGYRGRAKEAADRGVNDWMDDYRPLTGVENADHDIAPGDTAVVCELTIISRAAMCRKAGIIYRPTAGYGIVKAAEKRNREGKPITLNGGYTWNRKARNRALKDALSHAGFAATASEIFQDAERAGIDLGVDAETKQRTTLEQAALLVERAQNVPDNGHERIELGQPQGFEGYEDERQAQAQANIAATRGARTDDPLSIDGDPPSTPHSVVTELVDNGHAPDAELDTIPGAQSETKISDKQRHEMFAVATELYGRDQLDQFRQWIHQQYQVDTTNALTMRQGAEIIAKLHETLRQQQPE